MTHARVTTVLFAFAVLLAASAPTTQAADGVCNVARRKANLDFTVRDITGKDVRLSQYKGQVVLVNYGLPRPAAFLISSLRMSGSRFQLRASASMKTGRPPS